MRPKKERKIAMTRCQHALELVALELQEKKRESSTPTLLMLLTSYVKSVANDAVDRQIAVFGQISK